MLTIAATFAASLLLALLLTPQVIKRAKSRGLVDLPSPRRVHTQPIPRLGGVALFVSFYLPLAVVALLPWAQESPLGLDRQTLALLAGSALAFGVGLYDDLRSMPALAKLLVQALAGLVSWWGGIAVENVTFPGTQALELGWLSLPVTIFWFILVINAINLSDGLDGLAGGITFFVSVILGIICLIYGRPGITLGFAAMAGATLGFLRYNFNPASIFMGDGGSYFLGYMLAALSVMGSVKGQATVAIVIPIIAMGLPLIEALFTPVRRFLEGGRVFQPDKDHMHHRLLRLGLSTRSAVIVLYGLTLLLGLLALFLVQMQDAQAALLLLLLGVAIFLGIRKLGYLEYLALDKVVGWLRDITDELGIPRDRRTFLGWQMAIEGAETLDELWERVNEAAGFLGVDYLEMRLEDNPGQAQPAVQTWESQVRREGAARLDSPRTLFLTLPLREKGRHFGALVVAKDLELGDLNPFMFRRIEQLRRALLASLNKLSAGGGRREE